MKNNPNPKLSNLGKIIAISSAILAILRIIPTNGIIQWTLLLIGILLLIIYK